MLDSLAKRRKVVQVQPWQDPAEDPDATEQVSDRCRCPPGSCSCVGCSDHPMNSATIRMVDQLWRDQGIMLLKQEAEAKRRAENASISHNGLDESAKPTNDQHRASIGSEQRLSLSALSSTNTTSSTSSETQASSTTRLEPFAKEHLLEQGTFSTPLLPRRNGSQSIRAPGNPMAQDADVSLTLTQPVQE